MQYPICRHIDLKGHQCGSPALKDAVLCYHHQRFADRHHGFRHTELTRKYLVPGQHIELDPLEDRQSVQLALSLVINALAIGQLEPRRATALLYGLQLASMNSAKLSHHTRTHDIRETVTTPEGDQIAPAGVLTHKPVRL